MEQQKKTIKELLGSNFKLRLIGINRNGHAHSIFRDDKNFDFKTFDTEMTFHPDWNAWSVRLKKGPYQQLCIFEPSLESETEGD